MRLIQDGSSSAPIWLVGEAPGETEVDTGHPFSGASGAELNKMLSEAGISRSDCFATNVCHERPPSYVRNGKTVNNDIEQFFLTKTEAKRRGVDALAGRYPLGPVRDGLAHLTELLRTRQPRLVLALGNTPLWALTRNSGITKWRGSTFPLAGHDGAMVATFHPADVLRQWTHRPIVVQDFRRAARVAAEGYREPATAYGWQFVTEPTLNDIHTWFAEYARTDGPLICDTEGWGRVDCIGFATADARHAICIPFARPAATDSADCHYWRDAADEFAATQACRTVLSARPIIFHNALWDCQVLAARWALMPNLYADTQVAQHVAFPGLLGGRIDPVSGKVDKKGSSLSLSFCASMYCEHYRFWKDDGRLYDPNIHDERQYWAYNCEDCVRTAECWQSLEATLRQFKLRDQLDFEMRLFAPVFKMMFRGIRYDLAAVRRAREYFGHIRRKAGIVVERRPGKITEIQDWLNAVTDCADFNCDSTPQMRALFYDDFAVPQRRNRKTGAPTLDDAALDAIARQSPLLRPLVAQIQNYRTCDTLRGSLEARPSEDGRFRTALNVAFVETFRFSSNETAFGEGSNLQNIKRSDE